MSESNKISVVVLSDKRELLQMAAMIASVGAVSGNEVFVFLSMNALRYFAKGADIEAPAEGPVGVLLRDKKVPPFKTLFEQAVSLGDAKIHPCSMAMDILGFESEHLEDYIGEAMGLTMFLDEAKSGQVWSF